MLKRSKKINYLLRKTLQIDKTQKFYIFKGLKQKSNPSSMENIEKSKAKIRSLEKNSELAVKK